MTGEKLRSLVSKPMAKTTKNLLRATKIVHTYATSQVATSRLESLEGQPIRNPEDEVPRSAKKHKTARLMAAKI